MIASSHTTFTSTGIPTRTPTSATRPPLFFPPSRLAPPKSLCAKYRFAPCFCARLGHRRSSPQQRCASNANVRRPNDKGPYCLLADFHAAASSTDRRARAANMGSDARAGSREYGRSSSGRTAPFSIVLLKLELELKWRCAGPHNTATSRCALLGFAEASAKTGFARG